MMQSRLLLRTTLGRTRAFPRGSGRQQLRFQSSSSVSSTSTSSAGSSFGAGVAGGLAGALLFYSVYSLTPAGKTNRAINKAAKEASNKYRVAAKKIQEGTPGADQAIDSIRQFAYSYIGWIPGGRAYVDTAFKDIDTIRQNHREEADQVVSDAYRQLQDATKPGFSLETLSRVYDVLADLSKKLTDLGKDAVFDVLDNHPEVKDKLGGSVDQLRALSEQYGPEVKKRVDETWKQAKDILDGGFSAANLEKARALLAVNVDKMRKLGDELWNKGLEEAKPILDKNPTVKDLVEKNADALKQGNAKEVFERAKSAIETGDLGELEKYVRSAVDKAKSKGSDLSDDGWEVLDRYAKMVPQGGEVLGKMQQLRDVAESHKDEGGQLLKATMQEIKQVIEKRAQDAEELVKKAKKEAK